MDQLVAFINPLPTTKWPDDLFRSTVFVCALRNSICLARSIAVLRSNKVRSDTPDAQLVTNWLGEWIGETQSELPSRHPLLLHWKAGYIRSQWSSIWGAQNPWDDLKKRRPDSFLCESSSTFWHTPQPRPSRRRRNSVPDWISHLELRTRERAILVEHLLWVGKLLEHNMLSLNWNNCKFNCLESWRGQWNSSRRGIIQLWSKPKEELHYNLHSVSHRSVSSIFDCCTSQEEVNLYSFPQGRWSQPDLDLTPPSIWSILGQ